MVTFDELVTQQEKLGLDLQMDLLNYKKSPKDRKTLEYLQKKKELQKSWKSTKQSNT